MAELLKPRCGCPDIWLIETGQDRAFFRRQALGDFHAAWAGGVHCWNGARWVEAVTR